MTNLEIIEKASRKLLADGIIKGSGHFVKVVTDEGEHLEEIPEEMHTFQRWKQLGRQVKRGEKSKACIPIWKHVHRKQKDEEGKEEVKESMFLKNSYFFTFEQTEAI